MAFIGLNKEASEAMRSKEEQGFVDYLKKRWDDLRASTNYVIQKMHEDERKWCESVDAGKRTRAEANRALFHAEHVVSRTIRYTLLTAFCTFLEETAREFASRAFPSDFEDRARRKKGSQFVRYVKVLEDAGLDTRLIQADLEKFNALITLRNCVVHAWGKLSRALNPKEVKQAVAKIESADVYKDGFLYLGDAVLAEAIFGAENIGNEMIDQLLPQRLGAAQKGK
jgi:hypothetical protein